MNVNDNAPMFPNSAYSFSILENLPDESFVGQVQATDADGDTILYFISEGPEGV